MPSVEVLVAAGGGGGGGSMATGSAGGGGGAGGVKTNAAYSVVVASYTVTIGAAGAASASVAGVSTGVGGTGGDSVFDTITAHGGGGGGGFTSGQAATTGGSGGGGNAAHATGTAGEGNDGGEGNASLGASGGGGGKGSAGSTAASAVIGGAGGTGLDSSISGASVNYGAGGGGGGTTTGGAAGGAAAGAGGSGDQAGAAGATNKGGGAGGGAHASGTADVREGGPGGSGVVIVRYLTASLTATGGTIATDGAYKVHTFTTSGTFQVTALTAPPIGQTTWPNPVRPIYAQTRYGFERSTNLALYFPAPPFRQTTWPNPVRRVNAPAWQQSVAQGLSIPRDADYFYGLVWLSVNGIPRAQGRSGSGSIDFGSLTITDILDDAPNTCTFTARNFTPAVGQPVIVTLGSATLPNPERIFAGTILSIDTVYVGTPLNTVSQCRCIDWTWQLNRTLVNKQYTNQTATDIFIDLIHTYAAGFTVNHVALLGTIDAISFTNQTLTSALTQLMKRVGGYWYADYLKDCHAFTRESVTQPTALTSSHATLTAFAATNDLGPWITREVCEGGGGTVLTAVAVGETILPLDTATWYTAVIGGTVQVGVQRVTYADVGLGGGGGLVGSGASASAAPSLALQAGAGVETGAHSYAVTFVTGAGESLPGPTAAITVGVLAAPSTAPTAGTPTIGTGPNPGSHDYAVTFVTPSGETTESPTVTKATSTTTAPQTAPTAGTATSGGSVDDGNHDYKVTFVTPIGETTPSPVSNGIPTTIGNVMSDPGNAPLDGGMGTGHADSLSAGTYQWAITFVNSSGETLPSPTVSVVVNAGQSDRIFRNNTAPGNAASWNLYRTVVGGSQLKLAQSGIAIGTTDVWDGLADGSLGANAPASNTTGARQTVPLTGIPTGDANVSSRKLYRRDGSADWKLLATIGDNSTTTYSDTTAAASLGAAVPSTNTAYLQRIPLSNLPVSTSSAVTSRKVYRTVAGGAQLKLVTTIVDNVTTTYTDTVTDAGLGANVPTVNTATLNQVAVSSLQIGGTGVTQRKVYRTVAAGSQLKLLTTIADNTTAIYADSTADASLGANVPTSDTSGLAQPAGQVIAGSATLVMASTGALPSAGWVIIGNGEQIIRYTGKTASQLTGIPASGVGAIVATIGYNSTATAAPQLTGIPASGAGSIQYALVKGDPVNLLAIADDVSGQTALSEILDPTNALAGAAGIIENHLQDGRIAYAEALARAKARLALHGATDVRITYTVRDPQTAAGKTIHVDLPSPTSVTADFQIQHVTITTFSGGTPSLWPTYQVQAASTRFSFEDFLRMMRGA